MNMAVSAQLRSCYKSVHTKSHIGGHLLYCCTIPTIEWIRQIKLLFNILGGTKDLCSTFRWSSCEHRLYTLCHRLNPFDLTSVSVKFPCTKWLVIGGKPVYIGEESLVIWYTCTSTLPLELYAAVFGIPLCTHKLCNFSCQLCRVKF